MTSTIEERPSTSEAPPEASGKRPFRLRDMYWERKDGPVTMAERRRSALFGLIGTPVLFGIVAAIHVWGRGRELERGWLVASAIATVIITVMGFALPRFSPNGRAHLHGTDWSEESTTSKVVAIIAMLALVALLVARAVSRMD